MGVICLAIIVEMLLNNLQLRKLEEERDREGRNKGKENIRIPIGNRCTFKIGKFKEGLIKELFKNV